MLPIKNDFKLWTTKFVCYVFMMLPFIYNNKFSAILSGLSYVKYSTGYVVFLNFLTSKQYKYFILASIPYFVGWLIYFSVTRSDPLINFFEPIQLSLKRGISEMQIFFFN